MYILLEIYASATVEKVQLYHVPACHCLIVCNPSITYFQENFPRNLYAILSLGNCLLCIAFLFVALLYAKYISPIIIHSYMALMMI